MHTAKRLAAPLLGLLFALSAFPAQALQTATRVSSFTYDSTTGLLLSETVEPNTASLAVTTSYTYDAYGNKATVTVAAGAAASSPVSCGPTVIPPFLAVARSGAKRRENSTSGFS